jgi:hypothetical protein
MGMSVTEHLENAVDEWRSALGPDGASTAPEVLDRYARTTGLQSTRPLAVLFPRSTEETVSLVTIASRHQIPLHPISKGKNWGYGDATPPGDGQVIVDFGRMNRILELNRDSAYVVVEPGVTQGQLARYLAENGGGLWMDSTGAGPEASLVGNALDRGFGHTRYGDHFQTFCGLQIVLADGRVLEIIYDSGSGTTRKTRVRPYLLEPSAAGRSIYLIGWDETADAMRTYKVERIRQAIVTTDTYDIPEDFSAAGWLANSWGIWSSDGTPLPEIVLHFAPDVAARVRETIWHRSQVLVDLPDGGIELRVRVAGLVEIRPWILSWGNSVEVIEPAELRNEVAERLRGAAARYA